MDVVDIEQRDGLARAALEGYAHGPRAPIEARAAALAEARSARSIVLVEGVSDQIALETLARRHARDLASDGVVVVPIGGAHAVARDLVRFGPQGAGLAITGMCDAGEERFFRRGLATAGFGTPQSRMDMERLGFFVASKTSRTN